MNYTLEALPGQKLLREIHHRQILPVIGPGLVTVKQDGAQVPFYRFLAPQLAERLGVDVGVDATLNQVAAAHLARRGLRSLIYDEIRELVEEHESLPTPQGLMDLAAVRDFDLFISSTFDNFMPQALRLARPGFVGDERSQATFHPSRPVDLPDMLPNAFVYHALGTFNTYPDFAVWEEDYMEFLCGMLEAPRDTRRNLFRELRNRSLLLIGAPFDDWMVRFFLRVAKQGRLSERRDATGDYLAENSGSLGDRLVFYFDKVVGSPQIVSAEPLEFAAELNRRWTARYGSAGSGGFLESLRETMDHGSVFVSYSHKDMEAAITLATGLKAAGIPVWLDRRRLNPGGAWEQSLMRTVKRRASLFLSLISNATENNPGKFVHIERQWAAERHVPGEIFYIPILIDDTLPEHVSHEPEIFRPLHMYRMPGGKPTAEFAALLRRYLDQYEQEREIRDS